MKKSYITKVVFVLLLFYILFIDAMKTNIVKAEEILYGDVNGDKKINSLDYILIRKHILGQTTLNNSQKQRADIVKDNKINSMDYITIRKIILQGGSSQTTIDISDISLNKTKISLIKGQSETLLATVSPKNATNNTVNWSSSNTDVVVINDGKIFAVGEGSANVIASSQDGSKKAICAVTVIAETKKEPAEIIDVYGYEEGIAVSIKDNDYSKTKVFYSTDKMNWNEIDNELIRKMTDVKVRADILGLKAGKYYIKVIDSQNREKITDSISVKAHDRSGYAHFKYNKGVGAYNDDGTLKKDAVVLYVKNSNKNSVKLNINGTEYKGLVNILENIDKLGKPFVLRVIGKIAAPQLNYIKWKYPSKIDHINEIHELLGFDKKKSEWADSRLYGTEMEELGIASFSEDRKNGITQLDNLPYYVFPKYETIDGKKYITYDIHYNYIQITGASNLTIEGIGQNGELYQFGLRFSQANSIEVRNLKFTKFPDRALIISGKSKEIDKYGNYWVHNNTFNSGKNNFDVRPTYASNYAYENAYNPDETLGFTNCHGITSSYNVFNKSYKAYLINGSAGEDTYNVTLHHNYYHEVQQRIPRIRKANVHSYNNYYYKSRQMSYVVDMSAIVFSENNYYDIKEEGSKYSYSSPFRINWHNDYEESEYFDNSKVKSYGDYFSCDNNGTNLGKNYCIARVYTDTGETTGNPSLNLSHMFIATTRDQRKLNTINKPDLINNYSHFDTDANLFYYDVVNKKSNVKNMLSASDVKSYCKEHTGVLKR